MELCALCKKTKTGRLIEGVPVCGRCYLAGQYNLPENQAKLAEGDLTEPAVSKPPAEGEHKHRYTKSSDICKVPGCGHVRVPRKKK